MPRMSRPSLPWFRFYAEAITDAKLRDKTPAQRWLWVAVLAAASQSPIRGWLMLSERRPWTEPLLADFAGVPVKVVRETLPLFEQDGMLTMDTALGAWEVTQWSHRQYESDNVTARTRKKRSRERDRNVPTLDEERSYVPPETETETETETEAAAAPAVTFTPPPTEPAAAAPEQGIVDQALAILADRRVAANKPGNPVPYRLSVIAGLRIDHGDRLGLLDLAEFASAQQLADYLEPARSSDPVDVTTAARRAMGERADLPACDECGRRGGGGRVTIEAKDVDGRNVVSTVPCPRCGVGVPA